MKTIKEWLKKYNGWKFSEPEIKIEENPATIEEIVMAMNNPPSKQYAIEIAERVKKYGIKDSK